jgi:hypothetical protein
MTVSQTEIIIRELIPNIHVDAHLTESAFAEKYWGKYQSEYPSNNSLNGTVFEELIAISLVRKGIMPFYMQANIAFIPNVDYDFVIYCEDIGPLVLSAKVSLRERYKQADLEAVVLKNIHRKSESYLISANQREVQARKTKLDEVMAISDIIYIFSSEYDDLLDYISQKKIIESPIVNTVEASKVKITSTYFMERWTPKAN